MRIEQYIDHTILRPDATEEKILEACKDAKQHGFAAVCVNPCHTALVRKALQGSEVKTCVVVGFPLGANTEETKAFEAKLAIGDGAQEIDMAMNVGALKAKQYDIVEKDIASVAKVIKGKACLKVIIECCLLTDEEKVRACEIAVKAGADFVKTSTGFGAGGATVSDVQLIRKTVGSKVGVKASGGIRDYATAIQMIRAGANRIGTSSGVSIAEGTSSLE